MRCPKCDSVVGDAGICVNCGALHHVVGPTGWRPDPTARHEGRYYVVGRPTGQVRDGRKKSADPVGAQMLPGYLDLPPDRNARSAWLGTAGATAIIVMLAAITWVFLRPGDRPQPPDAGYLAALADAGLSGEFNSDANALAHAQQVCRQLDDGGPQQGLPADEIAVDAFCPRFAEGFHVLETASVSGTFVLVNTRDDVDYRAIATSNGGACEGAGGYADIRRDTQVTVKSGAGAILATTALGEGRGTQAACTFTFTFPITEGEDRYVVTVSHRGDFSFSFDQLRAGGVQIRLGH